MRELVTIQVIDELLPIENADAIELVHVLGWYCVAKKNEFQVGDLCVYAEVDSVFPIEDPRFAFLAECKGRIKTRKMRGVYSQGICFPTSILPSDFPIQIGLEVTDVLGVEQYVPAGPSDGGTFIGSFPSEIIHKSDETRIQTLKGLLNKYEGTLVTYTEKLDGTSATFCMENGEFVVCSRNLRIGEGDSLYWQMARKYDLANKVSEYSIQGEIIGPGIQGNKYKLTEREFRVFTIKSVASGKYLPNDEVAIFCKENDLQMVPILTPVPIPLVNDIDFWVEASKGKSVLNPHMPREGIVVRSAHDIFDPRWGRVSFKSINPEFLVKFKE